MRNNLMEVILINAEYYARYCTPEHQSAIRGIQLKYNVYEKYGVLEYNIVEENGFILQHLLKDCYYQNVNIFKVNDLYASVIFHSIRINHKDIF